MRILFLYLLLLVAVQAKPQSPGDPLQYGDLISADSLKQHLYVIASADMQGRETATPGQHKAAAYIEKEFERIGLHPGWNGQFQQPYPVFRDSLISSAMNLNGHDLILNKDFITSAFSANISLSAGEIIFVGAGQSDAVRDDYRNMQVEGKIVLIIPEKLSLKRVTKKSSRNFFDYTAVMETAKKHGAAAVLVEGKNFPRSPLPAKSAMYVDAARADKPPAFIISRSVSAMILGRDHASVRKKINAGKVVSKIYHTTVQLDLDKRTLSFESSNVIGYIEGTDRKEEAVIISAHYDHLGMKDSTIYFGADDDGSGTATVLELARAFATAAAEGKRPRRSILFMTVSGEEEGLWGSSYYAEHPVFPLKKTSADLNIDMIGRVGSSRPANETAPYIFVVGDNRISSELRPLSETVNHKNDRLLLDYKYNDPGDPQQIYYRSDHYNFAKNGVPVIFYFSGLHKDYHRPTDTPDKINYELLRQRARLIFFTAWEIANRNELLKRDVRAK